MVTMRKLREDISLSFRRKYFNFNNICQKQDVAIKLNVSIP